MCNDSVVLWLPNMGCFFIVLCIGTETAEAEAAVIASFSLGTEK